MARLEKAIRGEARRMVRSLMFVPTNTNAVMEGLEQRYGRPEFIIGALVEIAKKTPTPKESKLSSFMDFSNAISNLVTTVETLEVPAYLENPQLLQELVEKLPDSFRIQWGMKKMRLRSARATLVDFAEWVAEIAEAASLVSVPKFSFRDRKEESSFAADEVPQRNSACSICQADHSVATCDQFKKLGNKERWNAVKRHSLCFRCLRANHSIKDCKSKATCSAEGCSRRHHTLLHGPPSQISSCRNKEKAEDINATTLSASGGTLLRIVVVKLYGEDNAITCNALLDEGSTVTLISSEVADVLGLSGQVDQLRIKWTDGTLQQDNSSSTVDVWIGPDGEPDQFKMKKVRTVHNLRLPSQRTDLKEVVKQHPHLQQHKIRYLPGERSLIQIGQPHIHLSVAREVEEKDDDSPILTKTKLGWVVHGPNFGESATESAFLCHHESDDDIVHNLVKESFSLESIGIQAAHSTRSREDVLADERMKQMTRRVGDRWETGLLWRQEPVKQPKSRDVALSRLHGIERKLKRNEALAKQYRDKIAHYLECGYTRKLSEEELNRSSNVEWYLLHFDRTHPNKPGKIRIVFDAACRSQGVSLNDYLLTGPDLLVSLPGILIKFRQRKVAFSGDITEMFHQVKIRKEDFPAQRILWREKDDEKPSTYQLEVMMFGSACSQYCAQYVKNANALEFSDENPEAVESITKFHYMGDWLQSVDSKEEAEKLILLQDLRTTQIDQDDQPTATQFSSWKKRKVKGQTPVMGATPDMRIQPQPPPFNIRGMDYFDPMEVLVGRRLEKRYGIMFTCMNTRAVHLKVAHSLTTYSCILTIRRMIARRGQPSQFRSDHGTNLRGAEELDPERITGELDVQGTEWHFILPAAPHMGGSWERLVRSVKTALAVIMKSRAPKDEVLLTLFAEAEATVNSRPLVEVPVDAESPEALTPFYFLIETSSHKLPPGDFDVSNIQLDRKWRQSHALADLFWKRWVRKYGIVTQTFPGKDGMVRVAEVKTEIGIYRQPVVKLGKLDVRAEDQKKD